ncbi:MAG: hypothetical protein E7642_06070 [Ruminococcaceae bacterium]|nr:hypothetical protein [Oscillospiraceae bacterium]
MKRIASLFILICLLICLFASCNVQDASETTEASTDASTERATDEPTEAPTEAPTEKEKMTVKKILALFDDKVYFKQIYTQEMIATIREKLVLKGDILTVVHVIDLKTETDPRPWAYVYEFSLEEDAVAFEENRREFVDATEENGSCVRCGNIVIYGSSPTIATIEAE